MYPSKDISRYGNADAVQKLFQVELKRVRKKNIIIGLFLGVLLSILIGLSVASLLWSNKNVVAEKALDHIVSRYIKDLFESFPEGYVTHNQHKIMPILDDFTNAVTRSHVSENEFREIGRKVAMSISDKELTYHEIDAILSKMKAASQQGTDFN